MSDQSENARSLVSLAVKHPRLSIRKFTCKFNKRRGLSFSHEAVRQESVALPARLLKGFRLHKPIKLIVLIGLSLTDVEIGIK